MSELISRFFTFDDPKLNKVILKLPESWWSRPYEYAWAKSFVEQDHVVLDAACGVCHPFKFYLLIYVTTFMLVIWTNAFCPQRKY